MLKQRIPQLGADAPDLRMTCRWKWGTLGQRDAGDELVALGGYPAGFPTPLYNTLTR